MMRMSCMPSSPGVNALGLGVPFLLDAHGRSELVLVAQGHALGSQTFFAALGRRCRLRDRSSSESKLFGETILERLVSPLDAAFRGWRVGTDDVDVELLHGAAELRVADPRLKAGATDPVRARWHPHVARSRGCA